ncbi:hypothetical protein N7G274_000162 [Stereocaulon virgatum]|uniref:Uncharacterized protein n=1 Tax=Stereocaulon virgatum TaxID=373712 RepID=A0ABR4ARR8_9LECA
MICLLSRSSVKTTRNIKTFCGPPSIAAVPLLSNRFLAWPFDISISIDRENLQRADTSISAASKCTPH